MRLWEERLEHGEDVPVEELCKECPDLLPAVAAGIESRRRTGWLKHAAGATDTGDAPVCQRASVRVVAEVARHLHHARRDGLVHRDIRPANIPVDPHGAASSTDFGIAVTADEAQSLGADSRGTLVYMAPERVAAGRRSMPRRTSTVSAWCCMYRRLTGRLPFDGDTHPELIERIINRPAGTSPVARPHRARGSRTGLGEVPGERHGEPLPDGGGLAQDLERWLRRTPPVRRAAMAVFWACGVCGVLTLGLILAPGCNGERRNPAAVAVCHAEAARAAPPIA